MVGRNSAVLFTDLLFLDKDLLGGIAGYLGEWGFLKTGVPFNAQDCKKGGRQGRGVGGLEGAERHTDWTSIVQDRVTERIMSGSHSIWLAIYWNVRLSS